MLPMERINTDPLVQTLEVKFRFKNTPTAHLTEMQDIASPKIFSFAPAQKPRKLSEKKNLLRTDFVIQVCWFNFS